MTLSQAWVATAFLVLFAPAMRYLMGRMDAVSGGSLLAVGVMHASFNASGQLGVVDGDWQPIGARGGHRRAPLSEARAASPGQP